MSNGELLERLLDMVKFGWIVRLHKAVECCTSLVQNSTRLQNIAQVLRARPTQGIAHLTIAITLLLIASRSCLVSCQSDSVIVAICSLKSHRSRF